MSYEKKKASYEADIESLKDKECSDCSYDREPISLEDIKKGDPELFMFEQGKTCYCFFVQNLYKYVFDTAEISDEMYVKNAKNPLTGAGLGEDTVRRLHREYKKWHDLNQGDKIVDGILITEKNIRRFKEGMEDMEKLMRERGIKPSVKQIAQAYTSDLIELEDNPKKIIKIKTLYKFFVGENYNF